MVEIGAGGGSLARVDAMGRITVGPESAGAEPGPACYGRGGTHPTVTDADLVLGRIDPARFAAGTHPARRRQGRGGAARPNRRAASASPPSSPAMAWPRSSTRTWRMRPASMRSSAARSSPSTRLIAFGGAAPLHAARLAEKLGIARVIVPPNAGVGSAVGFLRAPIAFEVVRSRYMRLSAFDPAAANAHHRRDARRRHWRWCAPAPRSAPLVEPRSAFMRYVGQGHEIVVPLPARDLTAADAGVLRDSLRAGISRPCSRAPFPMRRSRS